MSLALRESLLQSYKLPAFDGPQLPQELWDIINKFVKQIEVYEKNLTNRELYDLRILQGWKHPKEYQGNWIERKYQKKWDTLDGPSRIKWYLGVGDNNLQFKNWDSKRTNADQLAIRGPSKSNPKKKTKKIPLSWSKQLETYHLTRRLRKIRTKSPKKTRSRAKSLTNFNKKRSTNTRAKTI